MIEVLLFHPAGYASGEFRPEEAGDYKTDKPLHGSRIAPAENDFQVDSVLGASDSNPCCSGSLSLLVS